MIKHLTLILTLAVAFASCSKEPEQTPGGDARNTLSFTYKSYRGTESRATVPASDAEKVIRDLDIFAFSGGQWIATLSTGSGYTETVSGDYSTLTVSPDFVTEHTGKQVVFYLVANNAASLIGSRNNTGKHIASYSGSEADFVERLTSELGVSEYYPTDPDKRSEILTIDPSSGGLLMTAKSNTVTLTGKQAVNVTFKRRVARFDIVNPVPGSFTVENIYVSEAPIHGPLFMQSTGSEPITTRPIEPLGSVLNYNAQNRAESVFYLYPTSLTTTKIAILGYFTDEDDNRIERMFELNSTENIIADNCYTLLFDEDELKLVAGVGDWDNSGKIPVQP